MHLKKNDCNSSKKDFRRMVEILLLAICTFFFCVYYIQPDRSIQIRTANVDGHGTILAYLESDINRGYFFEWNDILQDTEVVDVEGYSISADAMRFNIGNVKAFDIDEISVEFMGRIIQRYTGKELFDKLIGFKECEVTVEGDSFRYLNLDEDAYFEFAFDPIPLKYILMYFMGLALLSLVIAILIYILFQIEFELSCWRTIAFMFAYPAILLFLGEYHNRELWYLEQNMAVLNYCMLSIAFALLYILFGRLAVAASIVSGVYGLMCIASRFLIDVRGKPLIPQDILAIGTAMEVAGEYQITISLSMILLIIGIISLTVLGEKIQKTEVFSSAAREGIWLYLFASLLVCGCNISEPLNKMTTYNWESDIVYGYQMNGVLAGFVRFAQQSRIEEPEGYSVEILKSVAQKYQEEEAFGQIQPTNVIMIMNESFSCLHELSDKVNYDVTPFWNELKKEAIHGNLYISVRGGGTSNTEFEALTGQSLAMLPAGSYPFSQWITDPVFSLGSYFASLGYQTSSLHLHNPHNWNRKNAYPFLSLEPFYHIQNYEEFGYSIKDEQGKEQYLRGSYVSDAVNYQVLQNLEASMRGQPRFIFNVTLQNHGGYKDKQLYGKEFDLSEYGNYPEAEVYLSLINLSDDALRDLFAYYEQLDEPTMIIVFGDHQPALGNATDELIFEGKWEIEKYKTPFIIWRNYSSECYEIQAMSVNYLPMLVLQAGGFPLPPFMQMQKEAFKEYPVITQQGIIDADGGYYKSLDELPESELLTHYRFMQYNGLFDEPVEELYLIE